MVQSMDARALLELLNEHASHGDFDQVDALDELDLTPIEAIKRSIRQQYAVGTRSLEAIERALETPNTNRLGVALTDLISCYRAFKTLMETLEVTRDDVVADTSIDWVQLSGRMIMLLDEITDRMKTEVRRMLYIHASRLDNIAKGE